MYNKQKLLDLNIFYDNEYLDKYVELVNANLKTPKEQFRTAQHHIIPKAYFKKLNQPIDNSEENLVNLLHKDHALAHYYIALATKDPYFLFSSMSALQHIMGFNKKMKQEDISDFISHLDKYQELVEQKNKYHSEHTKGLLAGDNNPAKRPEVREKIRLSKLGNTNNLGKKIHDETWSKNQSEKLKGRIVITKNNVNKRVYEKDLQNYLDQGWIIGSKLKGRTISEEQKIQNGLAHKGRIRITNGTINKNILPEEFDLWAEKGFWRGLTTIPKEQRKKSTSCKGKIIVCDPYTNKIKYINKEDIAKFIELGYVLGRKYFEKKEN